MTCSLCARQEQTAAILDPLLTNNHGDGSRGCAWGVCFGCCSKSPVQSVFISIWILVRPWGEGSKAHELQHCHSMSLQCHHCQVRALGAGTAPTDPAATPEPAAGRHRLQNPPAEFPCGKGGRGGPEGSPVSPGRVTPAVSPGMWLGSDTALLAEPSECWLLSHSTGLCFTRSARRHSSWPLALQQGAQIHI